MSEYRNGKSSPFIKAKLNSFMPLETAVIFFLAKLYQTIWSFPLTNVKWHSVTWPLTMTTLYWSDFVPNATFYRILKRFHRTFATGVACRQGKLTPPNTWSRPFVILVETNLFFRTLFLRTMLFEYPRYFLNFAYNRVMASCMSWLISFALAYSSLKERKQRITKWKILAHNWHRTHDPWITKPLP